MMRQAGASAPDIHLPSLDGSKFVLTEQLTNGPVVLVFFKISCPTCQFTLPFLDRLYAGESTGSLHIVGVSQDKADATREFNKHFGIRFPCLLDPGIEEYPASNAYQITNVPSLFLVEPDQTIAWALQGFHKLELDQLGKRFGRSPFEANERVPAMRPG